MSGLAREAQEFLLAQTETLDAVDAMVRAAAVVEAGAVPADVAGPLAGLLRMEAQVVRARYLQDGGGEWAMDAGSDLMLDLAKAVLRLANAA